MMSTTYSFMSAEQAIKIRNNKIDLETKEINAYLCILGIFELFAHSGLRVGTLQRTIFS